jgi:hypothetical protein
MRIVFDDVSPVAVIRGAVRVSVPQVAAFDSTESEDEERSQLILETF